MAYALIVLRGDGGLPRVRLREDEEAAGHHPGQAHEAVLCRTVGDLEVMTAQLDHLLEAVELPNVSVRVLPFAAGPHSGAVAGSFVILDFPASNGGRAAPEPSIAYSESLTGALYLDKPAELAAYHRAWTSLDAIALDEAESKRMISKIIGETRDA